MKGLANDCNLTYPIFNISSLHSKMTRYDPDTVPIMRHWSKWPFHTEQWKKINPTPPRFFLLLYCCLHIEVALVIQAACTYVIYTKKNAACQIIWPRLQKKSNFSKPIHLILLFTSMLDFSLCLFFFCFFRLPPVSPVSPCLLPDTQPC